MIRHPDDFDSMGGPPRAIPWNRFKAEIADAYPGPPLCSRMHAKAVRKTLDALEAIDLAGEGEEPRRIRSTRDLTLRLVSRFRAQLRPDLSPFTIKGRLCYVRLICRFAIENRWLAVDPFTLRPMPRWVRTGRPAGKRHLSREECRRLLDVLGRDVSTRKGWALWKAHRLRVAVLIALYCGLRRNELLRLQVADVDLPRRLIHVRPHGKALKTEGSEDSVPIPEAIVADLEEWVSRWRLAGPEGFPIDLSCPWLIPTVYRKAPWVSGSPESRALTQLRRAGERAGLDRVNFQVLRRSCATLLEGKGVGKALIARILRHSEEVDERFYRQRDEDAMRAAARDLEI